jgi:glycosyltransferase involved in cell wall biosynthesis
MLFARSKTILLNKLKWNGAAHNLSAAFETSTYVWKKLLGAEKQEKLVALMNIIRRSKSGIWNQFVRRELRKLDLRFACVPHSSTNSTHHDRKTSPDKFVLYQSIVIKEPSYNEKGVLFLAMETELSRLLQHEKCSDVFSAYDVVLASGWSPPNYKLHLEYIAKADAPLFVTLSNSADVEYYDYLVPQIVPLPILTCDWLNPSNFNPKPAAERDIDIIMVAGWGKYKRHWLLFEALRKMPSNLYVVMVGGNSQGRTVEDIKQEAKNFGIKQDIEFLERLPIEEVNKLQARSKIATLFSDREGSCIAVTESLMSNTPVAMMADAHVGAKKHINSKTGILCSRRSITRDLTRLLDTFDTFRAREWAEEEISYIRSRTVLIEHLRKHALEAGRRWTCDIANFYWNCFTVKYTDIDAEKYKKAAEKFEKAFGMGISHGI